MGQPTLAVTLSRAAEWVQLAAAVISALALLYIASAPDTEAPTARYDGEEEVAKACEQFGEKNEEQLPEPGRVRRVLPQDEPVEELLTDALEGALIVEPLAQRLTTVERRALAQRLVRAIERSEEGASEAAED
jgi:hypothetical protein